MTTWNPAGMGVWVAVAGIVGAAWWLTGRVRQYALAHQLLDIPNARSSHAVVTPRGGGIAIVVATVVSVLGLAALGQLPWLAALGLTAGGGLVAIVGFQDDRRGLPARVRLVGHFSAAGIILATVGVGPVVGVPPSLAFVVGAVYLVWLLNLTNFMDGIDGLASVEVITVCAGGVVLHLMVLPGDPSWQLPVALAAATAGFLVWNWPPAKIFMGDAGSGFVGLMLGALSLQAGHRDLAVFVGWLILLGVFLVDTTLVLGRRILRGERFYEAHRSHAYQHAALHYGSHRVVTVAVCIVNLTFLLPTAMLVVSGRITPVAGLFLAYVPLILLALWWNAGAAADEPRRGSTPH